MRFKCRQMSACRHSGNPFNTCNHIIQQTGIQTLLLRKITSRHTVTVTDYGGTLSPRAQTFKVSWMHNRTVKARFHVKIKLFKRISDPSRRSDSGVISSYRIYASGLSAMMWGKLCEMFVTLTSASTSETDNTNIFVNQLIQFYSKNATTSHSSPCCPTT